MDADAVEQVFKKQNRLDILCNNAGTLPTSDIKKFVDTNLVSKKNNPQESHGK